MQNFKLVENIIEKINGDEQRHQILGQENLNCWTDKKKKYFEVKIISTIHAGIVIGVVTNSRKN
jgi:hypothetical protein